MTPVFNITRSALGQRWQWRGGVAPDPAEGGDDALMRQLFRARGAPVGGL